MEDGAEGGFAGVVGGLVAVFGHQDDLPGVGFAGGGLFKDVEVDDGSFFLGNFSGAQPGLIEILHGLIVAAGLGFHEVHAPDGLAAGKRSLRGGDAGEKKK